MNILQKILARKRREVTQRKSVTPVAQLERSPDFSRETHSLAASLRSNDTLGIIAEIKRASPSEGDIHPDADVAAISTGYLAAGAAGLSILTDEMGFRGTDADLQLARQLHDCPILRKDFVVDEYQLIEAKALGADVVLLIAAAQSPEQTRQLAVTAHNLGLEVLLEVRDRAELEAHYVPHAAIVGVNNRDLRDFSVSVERSLDLLPHLPAEAVHITESGISNAATLARLLGAGFHGALIGSHFMRHAEPPQILASLIADTHSILTDSTITA